MGFVIFRPKTTQFVMPMKAGIYSLPWLAECRLAGFGWAVVLGEPAYYARFGFSPASAVGLGDEYGGGPAFQVIELIPGQLPSGAGIVSYAPEFAALASTTR